MNWQTYQRRLKRANTLKKSAIRVLIAIPALFFLLMAFHATFKWFSGTYRDLQTTHQKADTPSKERPFQSLSKKELQLLLSEKFFIHPTAPDFEIEKNENLYRVETFLDLELQDFILNKMDRKNSRYIGFVAMEPRTGRVISLASFDRINPDNNTCLDTRFPAASIFKIVTAAAAAETCGFSPSSTLTFNGGKHTLYKRQLKDWNNRYTNRISFKKSFAQSVNPVFGKLGSNYLRKEGLEKYAAAFGFNETIDFELPLDTSRVSITDDSYQWAEIASGFNNETVISPLHGALVSAVILNSGTMVEPTIVKRILDDGNREIYNSEPRSLGRVITPQTSAIVYDLMKSTVRSGTSRKAFRGYGRDRILSKLTIGGKTGSINNKKNYDIRFDWFVGFAEEKEADGKLAIAVVVAHEKYIGKRASYYARIAIKKYFSKYMTQNEKS